MQLSIEHFIELSAQLSIDSKQWFMFHVYIFLLAPIKTANNGCFV